MCSIPEDIVSGKDLLTPRPTPKLEDHPLSAVRHCFFTVFTATLNIRRPSSLAQTDAPCTGDKRSQKERRYFEDRNVFGGILLKYICKKQEDVWAGVAQVGTGGGLL
jgi:hypothetical protein